MSYLNYSTKVARFLTKKTGQSREKEEILAYAVEVLILNILNILLVVIIGFMLGVLKNTLICFFTASVIRLFSGGAHSKFPWRCAAVTGLVFPVLGLIGEKLALIGNIYIYFLLIISVLISASTLYRLAPVDTPAAPIISHARRRRLKTLSLFILAVLTCSVVIIILYIPDPKQYITCFSMAVLWNSFILTSWGHFFFNITDQIKIQKGGIEG